MRDATKLLKELIALPSVNPALATADGKGTGERLVTDYLASLAGRAGLELDFQSVLPGRENLLVRLLPRKKTARRILLAPHLDTVGGTKEQFMPRKSGTRLCGRGACDTKGSVAAMFAAICELARSGVRPESTEIVFAGLVDEEHAQAGSRALAGSRIRADLAIVGEPTRLKVVTAHKGSVWVHVETHGRQAHGSRPELGRNAIHEMVKVVELLETTYARQLRKKEHPLLGRGTVSVGVICGGTQANIVPDGCEIMADRRTLPGESDRFVRAEVSSLLRKHRLRASLRMGKEAPCLPMETDARLPLVSQFLRSAGQRQPAGVVYFCDAAVLSAAGIPSVVFGPGDIAQAHTADEWIDLNSLERAKALLVRFLRSVA